MDFKFSTQNTYIFVAGIVLGGVLMFLFLGDTVTIERLRTPGSESTSLIADNETVQYASEQYGFSLQYPKELVIKEFDEGGDSQTVVFQKPREQVGFQVYITPHNKDTIDGPTILRDVSSGVIIDLKEEQLREDLRVATFWSEAPLTGRTREIWFLRDGYLYEFTAYAAVENSDQWLKNVVSSIQFIKQ